MKTEVIRRRLHTFASENHPQNAKEWLARTSATLRSSLWYEKEVSHIRPSAIPLSRSSVCGSSADSEIALAIWLPLDGTFASCQQAVSRQSVPTDQLSVQYLYCTDSVRSVLADGLRQRQWAVVPFSCSPKPSVILPRKESKEYASIGDTTLRAKQNGSTRRMRPIGSIRPTCERGKATPSDGLPPIVYILPCSW